MAKKFRRDVFGSNFESFKDDPALGKIVIDPFGIAKDIAKGLAFSVPETAYDFGSFFYNVGAFGGIPFAETISDIEPARVLSPEDDFFDFMEIEATNLTKTVSALGSLAIPQVTLAKALTKIPRIQKLLTASPRMQKFLIGGAIELTAGFGADLLGTRAKEGSVFSLIPKEHQSDFLRWFTDRDENSEFNGRFKNAIEGTIVATALGLTLKGTISMFKTAKRLAHKSSSNPKELLDTMDETLGVGDGKLTEKFLEEETIVGGVEALNPKIKHNLGADAAGNANATHIDTALGVPSNLPNAEQIKRLTRDAVDTQFELTTLLRERLADPNISKEDKKFITKLIETQKFSKLNPAHSGDAATDGGVRFAQLLNLESKIRLNPRSRAELILDTSRKMESEELSASIEGVQRTMGGGDLDNIKLQIATVSASTGNVEEVITAARDIRSRIAIKVGSKVKSVNTKIKDMTDEEFKQAFKTDSELREWLNSLMDLDELDSYIAGSVGSSGRILNMQKVDANDLAFVIKNNLHEDRLARTKGAETPETLSSMMISVIDNDGIKEFKRISRKVEELGEFPTKKGLDEILTVRTAQEFYKSFLLGSILSSPKTIIGSVGLGGLAATTIKQVLDPLLEATINLRRFLGIEDRGGRLTDPIASVASFIRTMYNQVAGISTPEAQKSLITLAKFFDSTKREGTEFALSQVNRAEYIEEIGRYANKLAEEGAYKRVALIKLISPLAATVQSIQNKITKNIVKIDTFVKINNANVTLNREASKAWYREAILNPGPGARKSFMSKYRQLQDDVIELSDSRLSGLEKQSRIDKIFKGNEKVKQAVLESIQLSRKTALESTFQQEATGFIADQLKSAENSARKHSSAAHIAYTTWFPFTKTPIDIMNEAITYSPLSPLLKKNMDLLKNGTPDQKLAVITKISSGLAMMGTAYALVDAGIITGTFTREERKKFEAAGIPENSILIGGKWWSYEKLSVQAIVLSGMADAVRNNPDSTSFMQATHGLTGAITLAFEQGHMETMTEIFDSVGQASQGNEQALVRSLFDKATASIVPLGGLQTTLNDLIQGGKKRRSTLETEVGAWYDQLQGHITRSLNRYAGAQIIDKISGAGIFQDDVDVFGDEIMKTGESISSKILTAIGVGSKDYKHVPFITELNKFNLIPSGSKTLDGVKLTREEFKQYSVELFQDTGLIEELNRIVTNPTYLNANESFQEQYLKNAIGLRKRLMEAGFVNRKARLKEGSLNKAFSKLYKFQNKVPNKPGSPEYNLELLLAPKVKKEKDIERKARVIKESLGIK